jgi:hypothetical protein
MGAGEGAEGGGGSAGGGCLTALKGMGWTVARIIGA